MAEETKEDSSYVQRRSGMQPDFFFQAGPYSSDDLKVVRFEGIETISQPFVFQLDVVMEESEPDFEGILGQSALLTIEGSEGTRYVSGIVSRFEQSAEPTRLTQYRAELVPKIWLLGLRHKSRIFQDISVPDIVKKVLTEAGIPSSEFQFKTQRSYQAREYCVQYRESELAFISRLMEEEGIYYWFEHSQNSHTLIMGDATSAHVPIAGDANLVFHSVTGEEPNYEHVYRFRYAQEVRPGEVVIRDFDFKKPKLDLTAQKSADRNTNLQIYDYPGEYVQPSEGTTLSEVRLQELQTSRKVGEGDSNCKRLLPGYKFTLEQHPRTDLNQDYLLTRVSHLGTQVQALKEAALASQANEYRAQFRCIPAPLQFRPSRVTPRPAIYGSQTAIVTGPAGEEIYPDEHGRIKVQFHWDREGKHDEKSSCWIRVSQTWAGPSWGAIIIPRIGQEVVVQFLEGDPDRPIITGTVYNGDNRPPFALPGGKSQAGFKSNSTLGGSGYNEFVMDDTKGKELIRVHGQFDKDTTIEHDLREHVFHDRNRDVTNNETIQIGVDQTCSVGNNQTSSVGVNKSIQVGANHTESIGATMSLTVGANKAETVALASAESVGAAKTLTVGGAYQITVGAAMNETVGGAKMEEVGALKMETVGGDSSEKVGSQKNVSVGTDFSLAVGKNLGIAVKEQGSVSIEKDLDVGTSKNLNIQAKEDIFIQGEKDITIRTGSAQITLKTNGDIEIKGNAISIKGSSDVKIKGSKVAIN